MLRLSTRVQCQLSFKNFLSPNGNRREKGAEAPSALLQKEVNAPGTSLLANGILREWRDHSNHGNIDCQLDRVEADCTGSIDTKVVGVNRGISRRHGLRSVYVFQLGVAQLDGSGRISGEQRLLLRREACTICGVFPRA